MLNTISIQINHRIHNQFFFNVMLRIDIIKCIINTQNDMNNHTGYTPSNFVKALLSVNARMAKMLSVGFHITESHKVRKIQNIISALAIDRNKISAQIFLFSDLLMLEKNVHKHIQDAINIPIKCKLKFCGLIIVRKLDAEFGINVHVSSAKLT